MQRLRTSSYPAGFPEIHGQFAHWRREIADELPTGGVPSTTFGIDDAMFRAVSA
jgi:hypothetical protein